MTIESLAPPPLNWRLFSKADPWGLIRLLFARQFLPQSEQSLIGRLVDEFAIIRDNARRGHIDSDLAEVLYFQHLRVTADVAAVMLTQVARDHASVAIKLLWKRGGPVVRTLFRGGLTAHLRDRIQPPNFFPFTVNTAFSEILLNEAAQGYFAADNLAALAAQGKYQSGNDRWPQYYNATAVAAIRSPNAQSPIIGFVCVDTSIGNLTGVAVRRTLELVASHIFNLLHEIDLLRSDRAEAAPLGWRKQGNLVVELDEAHQRQFETNVEALLDHALEPFSIHSRAYDLLTTEGVNTAIAKLKDEQADFRARAANDVEPLLAPGVVDPREVRRSVEALFSEYTPEQYAESVWRKKPDIARAMGLPQPKPKKD